jgi:nucleotide-binding universal stress UspA family protein
VTLKSAAVIAAKCGAVLRLVHVIEPLDVYQRASHPLTFPFTMDEIAEKTGSSLQALAASPEFAHLKLEYEVREGKPFVEIIVAGKASGPHR